MLLQIVFLLLLYWFSDPVHNALSPWEWYRVQDIPREIPLAYYHDPPHPLAESRRANAALLMVAKNYELKAVVESMKSVEDRFNKRFKYPWVLLSEVPFTRQFKRYAAYGYGVSWFGSAVARATREITDANITYGLIEPNEWLLIALVGFEKRSPRPS